MLRRVKVRSIRRISPLPQVYNLDVADNHNYFAGGILVHNCVDDPHAIQQAESDTIRQGVCDWWDQVMSTRRNTRRSTRVIIMQRCHELDLAGHVLGQGGWVHLMLPAEYEPHRRCSTPIGFQDPRQEPGELLWPARFGEAEVARQKVELGAYAAAGQLGQRPAPLEGGIVRRSWWRFYQRAPEKFDEVIQSWDMTFKDLSESSYVAGGVWGRVGADKYLLDQVRERLNFVDTLRAVLRVTQRWPAAHAKYVEDKANGPAVMCSLRNKVSGLIAIQPNGSKIARAQAVSPQVESGNVWLPSPQLAPWINNYLDEWTNFPNGANDDQVDQTTQALLKLEERSRRRVRLMDLPDIISETRVNPRL